MSKWGIVFIESGDFLYSMNGIAPYSCYELENVDKEKIEIKIRLFDSSKDALDYLRCGYLISCGNGYADFRTENLAAFEIIKVSYE